ncbi:MAG: DUF2029 domain-containing protein [Clostridia bacterium]|nr:DUF2029 domain-containing protein [Clostridia bacterium]
MRQSEPKVFPTQHILTITVLATLVYLLLYFVYTRFKKKDDLRLIEPQSRSKSLIVIFTLFAALVIRILLSVLVEGHKTDINCFTSWANTLYRSGFQDFYNGAMPDYPPGYMYVLRFMASIATAVFGHGPRDQFGNYDLFYVSFIKLPAIIADLGAAYFVYNAAQKRYGFSRAFFLLALVAFNPLMIYISSGWGQIDQILTVFITFAIYELEKENAIIAGFLYGLSILLKPQALMVGPLFAVAYFCYVFEPIYIEKEKRNKEFIKRLGKTAAAVLVAVLMLVLSALPFSRSDLPWYRLIHEKYLGTATSYDYASVNAYNIFTLFGKNWARVDQKSFIGLTLGQLGTIGMAYSVLLGCVIYIVGRKKNRGAMFLAAAFTFASLFTLGHYMHERYMFPVLLLLFAAYLYYDNKYLLYLAIAYTAFGMLNCLCAFYYSQYHQYYLYWDKGLILFGSICNVITFIALKILCIYLVFIRRKEQEDGAGFAGGKTQNVLDR